MSKNDKNGHLSSFWPLVILCVVSAIIGGLIVLFAFYYSLNEEVSTFMPGQEKVLKDLHDAKIQNQ